jgi:hypothetical protein
MAEKLNYGDPGVLAITSYTKMLRKKTQTWNERIQAYKCSHNHFNTPL